MTTKKHTNRTMDYCFEVGARFHIMILICIHGVMYTHHSHEACELVLNEYIDHVICHVQTFHVL
jgi:hypothetical protein